jgi:hypothetical protein
MYRKMCFVGALCGGLALAASPRLPAEDKVPAGRAAEAQAATPDLSKTQVSLPWRDLVRLLEQSGGGEQARPPVDYVFAEAACNAAVQADRATVTTTVEVNALGPRWSLVPLGPAGTPILSAKADGSACPLVLRDGTLYALFTGPGKHQLALTMQQKISESPAGRRLEIPLIPSPLVALTVALPETGLEVQCEGGAAVQSADREKTTVVTASYRGAGTAAVVWKARPAVARPARFYADTETVAVVDEGLVRVNVRADTQILQAPARQLRFQLDRKAVVLGVSGLNVARWIEEPSADPKRGEKTLVVILAQPVQGDQPVEIAYELDVPAEGGPVSLALPALEGARRDQGWLAVAATGVLQVEPAGEGGLRVGVSQLPPRVRGAAGAAIKLAYRYTKPAAAVGLVLSRPKPQTPKRFATTNTLVSLQPGRLVCEARVHYEVLHAGVDRLRIGLPEDVELLSVRGDCVRGHAIVGEEKGRVLVVDPKDLVQGECEVRVAYVRRFKETDKTAAVPLLTHPDAEIDRGHVGLEVRANYEIAPAAEGFERMDVKELPGELWSAAGAPILFGYRYAAPQPAMTLSLARHEDLSVLVAMSDFCEACTVVTPDGKCVTKMMFVTRNNMKPFLTLKLPEGAEMWSALVDDCPVTPARNGKGAVLVPLKKSEEVDEDDEESYRARREKRRKEGPELQKLAHLQEAKRITELQQANQARDLKPYDVEIVFIGKKLELAERGQLKLALPQADVPTGHLAWAVFLPRSLHLADAAGNLQEVANFTLPFRHFAVVEYQKRQAEAMEAAKQQQALAQAAKQLDKAAAEAAKAQGVLPVRIEIPITGEIYKFEKFMVVDETPEMSLSFRRKTE